MSIHIEGEEALIKLREMFSEYMLDEYLPYFEALEADFNRVSEDNRKFRMEAIGRGKGTAA